MKTTPSDTVTALTRSLLEAPGSSLPEERGLRVRVFAAGYLLLQSASESHLQDTLTSEIGLRLPGPQEVTVRGEYALLWLTPAEWLFELPASETESLQGALTRRLTASLAVVTDMSDAFACFEITGECAAHLLMSGCGLKLDADAFPVGHATRTALAHIPAIIWNRGRDPERLRIIVDRSYARHLRDWLLDVSRS